MGRPKGSKNKKTKVVDLNFTDIKTIKHDASKLVIPEGAEIVAPPKVEFGPAHIPTPEPPPAPGLGASVNYNQMKETVVPCKVAPKDMKLDMDLLKAGVKDPFLPSTPLGKDTTKETSAGGPHTTPKADIFTRTPPIKKVEKTMSHPGTIKTTF